MEGEPNQSLNAHRRLVFPILAAESTSCVFFKLLMRMCWVAHWLLNSFVSYECVPSSLRINDPRLATPKYKCPVVDPTEGPNVVHATARVGLTCLQICLLVLLIHKTLVPAGTEGTPLFLRGTGFLNRIFQGWHCAALNSRGVV